MGYATPHLIGGYCVSDDILFYDPTEYHPAGATGKMAKAFVLNTQMASYSKLRFKVKIHGRTAGGTTCNFFLKAGPTANITEPTIWTETEAGDPYVEYTEDISMQTYPVGTCFAFWIISSPGVDDLIFMKDISICGVESPFQSLY
jgi:hypothetical protein